MRMRHFLFGLAAVLLSQICAAAQEGIDYVVLQNPKPQAQGTLTKIFSYDCKHCYKFDITVDADLIARIKQKTNLTFNPVHIEQRAKYGRTACEFFALCILRDKAAGRDAYGEDSLFKKAKDALFAAYHKDGTRWLWGESSFIDTLTKATGISSEDFSQSRRQHKVQALCDEWKWWYEAAKRQGIPAYVVNGKYLLLTANLRSVEQMAELIEELSKLP